jgi:hypothetical protein
VIIDECTTCGVCEQPPNWEHVAPDGIFIKQMYLKEAGTMIPQHAHAYDHTSMLAKGRIRAWSGDELMGEYEAPAPIFIKARVKHTFLSLEPGTLIYCIHKSEPVIVEEHQFDAHSIPLRQV